MTNAIKNMFEKVSGPVLESIALLLARLGLGGIFYRSAASRMEEGSWTQLTENAVYQFSEKPFNQVPIINGEFGAYFTSFTELAIGILLMIGLATRFGALAVIGMAVVIQTFVFPSFAHLWTTVAVWVALALILIVRGGGIFSVDRLIGHKFG
ncbi:hypothetical protein MNBD_ALPHA04-512 [hydrothermal vent metagenome]|uniref:DoxX family protein n=1 Tax=hydrothermal vent metagenome TaxID=652676 RepID=A0A3B0RKF1_9ZZZZ